MSEPQSNIESMIQTDFIIQPLLEHYANSQNIIKQTEKNCGEKDSVNNLLANEVETNHIYITDRFDSILDLL